MDMNTYTEKAMRTNDGKCGERLETALNTRDGVGEVINAALGLSGEVGELNDAIKKSIYHGHALARDYIKEELGDILWYIAMMCTAYGLTLEEIAENNIDKLLKRYPDGFSESASQNRAEYKVEEISSLKPGEHFTYNDIEFIALDIVNENVFAITAECWDELPFNSAYKDGCNNWRESSLRRYLNKDVLEENFDIKHLVKQTTDLTADNGDKVYGTCEDYITMLSCEQYRKYREFVPLFDEYMWTVSPWRCDTDFAYSVRHVHPSGALNYDNANNSSGLALACIFNHEILELRRQAQETPNITEKNI